jgi:NADH-quinone oxidoreductase subunit E
MSVRRLAEDQPLSFAFTPENEAWSEEIIKKYPEGRQASAVISLLWRAQKQNNYWLPRPAIEKVAEKLGMPYIRVLEIATFYTMFNLSPVGKFYLQLCGTTPCQLAGSDEIKAVLQDRVGEARRVTPDGNFSWTEVECLGACCNAPMVQINDDYYEDLTPENFAKLLDDLAEGRPVKVGSQTGRVSSEPIGGLTSLTSLYGADGRSGPQSANATPRAGDKPAARTEYAARDMAPNEPAGERLKPEAKLSTARPEGSIVKTKAKRTGIGVSKAGKNSEVEARDEAAKAGGAQQGGPSAAPGVEPAAAEDSASDPKQS